MGGLFSGRHGRRSARPFYDELPRITIANCKQNAPGLIYLSWQGQPFAVKKIIVSSGCMRAPRLACSKCGRACKLLYLRGVACCFQCTGARYRTQSESPSRRAVRRAEKIWRRCKHDFKRPGGKPRWQRWATFERLEAEVEAVAPIIEAADHAPYAAIAKLEAKLAEPKRKRGRPPQG